MEFGKKIQRLRELHDWTQQELAAQTGVTQASIARLEAGRITDPKAKGVLKLARVLGVPVEVLLDDSVSIEKWKEDVSEIKMDRQGRDLLKLQKGLNVKQRKLLLDFAHLLKHQ